MIELGSRNRRDALTAFPGAPAGGHAIALGQQRRWESVESSLGGYLDAMWAEGPGGGHYDNMTGNSTKMACDNSTTASGKVWLVRDFSTE